MPAERVDPALNNLEKAGWVKRLTRGFYELVEDPRE
jgi:predicted transcriptional regulator of viral defense system